VEVAEAKASAINAAFDAILRERKALAAASAAKTARTLSNRQPFRVFS
jgi:hypothetical protein